MQLANDVRHKMLCFLADWYMLGLPPGCSEFTRLEVWDREYEWMKRLNDAQLWASAREAGFDVAADEH